MERVAHVVDLPTALALFLATSLALVPGAVVGQPPDGGPVSLHPGAVYARLTQATFEPVTTVAGQGAFSRVPAPDHTLEPAVLVSHRMARGGEVDVHGTLGTGLADPGEMLLLGVSIGLRRVFLTAGAATRLVEEGTDPLEDEVFRGEGDRTLYAGLVRGRIWGGFLGVSVGILP